jgi:hypothetical protein
MGIELDGRFQKKKNLSLKQEIIFGLVTPYDNPKN